MCADIRKIVDYIEDTFIEGERQAPVPLRMAVSAAVIKNPWSGQGYVEDLQPAIFKSATVLADALVPRLLNLMGSAESVEAFGKCAVVGMDGEIEHAAGLIHTLHFGNEYRKGVEADSFIPFTNKRAGPGTVITVPMNHKMLANKSSRAHFLTVEFSIGDAPAANEVVVALAAASGGRPHHRIGDRLQDMQAMGVDQTGKPLEQ